MQTCSCDVLADETYVKVKGKWVYLYRAVDKFGDAVDFMLSEQRDEMAAATFFKQAINGNGFPHKIVMDKSSANYAGLEDINRLLMLAGLMNRKLKKISSQKEPLIESDDHETQEKIVYRQSWFPWLLLFLTWLGVGIYFLV